MFILFEIDGESRGELRMFLTTFVSTSSDNLARRT